MCKPKDTIDFRRMADFTGYIGHMNNQTQSELRQEIILSEDRVKTELRTEIAAVQDTHIG